MTDLVYEPYNKKSLAVRGDRNKYQDLLKGVGGRWNSRMRGGEGWLVPMDNESQLKKLIAALKKVDKLKTLENAAKSRKGQNKYHREESEDEEDEGSEGSEGEGSGSEDEGEGSGSEDEGSNEYEDSGGSDIEIDPVVAQMLEKTRVQDSKPAPTPAHAVEAEAIQQKREEERKRFEDEKREYEAAAAARQQAGEQEHERVSSKKQAARDERKKLKAEIARREQEKIARRAAKKEAKEQSRAKVDAKMAKHSHDRRSSRKEKNVDPVSYYKSFTKKPVDFRELYASSDGERYSSSASESESSDDFPSPGSPKRRGKKDDRHSSRRGNGDDYETLFDKVRDMSRRLYEVEIQNRKLKASASRR